MFNDFLFSAEFFLPYLEHCGASEASGSILQDHLSFFCYLVKNLSRKVVGAKILVVQIPSYLQYCEFQRKGGKEVKMLNKILKGSLEYSSLKYQKFLLGPFTQHCF